MSHNTYHLNAAKEMLAENIATVPPHGCKRGEVLAVLNKVDLSIVGMLVDSLYDIIEQTEKEETCMLHQDQISPNCRMPDIHLIAEKALQLYDKETELDFTENTFNALDYKTP